MVIWNQKTLDKLGSLKGGRQTHKPEYDSILFFDGKVPFVESSQVEENRLFVKDSSRYYNSFGVKQSYKFAKDSICITNNGRVNSAILREPACLCNQLYGFCSFENVSDVKFIKYCFDFSIVQKKLLQVCSIGAKYLSMEKLLTVSFPNPNLKTQQKIGKILSTYDLLIENYQRQIEEAKKQVVWEMIHTS